jgi:hypothetical protein
MPETLQAFEGYVRDAEAEMEQPSRGKAPSSWFEASDERTRQLLHGSILAQFWPEGRSKWSVVLFRCRATCRSAWDG